MPENKIQWDLPNPFTLSLAPQPEDIDGLGHTNNAVYVQWCEQAGWAHSMALGLSVEDYRRLNRGMAIRRGEYSYLLPTTEAEPLVLGTWLLPGNSSLSAYRCFQLVRLSDLSTVLRGRWELVCIELSSGRPKRFPAEFKDAYQSAMVAVDLLPDL
jgi:acyl-CoA thioester hydrolase